MQPRGQQRQRRSQPFSTLADQFNEGVGQGRKNVGINAFHLLFDLRKRPAHRRQQRRRILRRQQRAAEFFMRDRFARPKGIRARRHLRRILRKGSRFRIGKLFDLDLVNHE